VQHVAAAHLLCRGAHGAGVRAGVGLGQPEAADDLARGQPRQVLATLLLGAVLEDREHHQARLHRHGRAIAAVHALDLARDQAVAHVIDAGAAVLLGQRAAEQVARAHLAHDLGVEALLPVGLEDARHQVPLRVLARAVADHALVPGELGLEQEGI
jgi:hypothetical protein